MEGRQGRQEEYAGRQLMRGGQGRKTRVFTAIMRMQLIYLSIEESIYKCRVDDVEFNFPYFFIVIIFLDIYIYF